MSWIRMSLMLYETPAFIDCELSQLVWELQRKGSLQHHHIYNHKITIKINKSDKK